MPPPLPDVFPFVAVRDLLGIMRALWLATDEAHVMVRRRIEEAARKAAHRLRARAASREALAEDGRRTLRVGLYFDVSAHLSGE
jgi:hypothetical protein